MSGFLQILDNCNGLAPIVKLVKNGIFPIIQIGIPIILIVMGSIDLGKAVISSDEKAIKAAQGMLIKRAISAVIVFLIVTIVSIVMNLLSATGDKDINNTGWQSCWNNPDGEQTGNAGEQ